MLRMLVHVVREMVIVVARADRVIVVVTVGDNHSTILTGRWATVVAWVIIRIVAIPHVDSLVVGGGITPSGCSVVNLHLPADGGRGGLFPASGLQALVLFAATAPARWVLLHRAGTTP